MLFKVFKTYFFKKLIKVYLILKPNKNALYFCPSMSYSFLISLHLTIKTYSPFKLVTIFLNQVKLILLNFQYNINWSNMNILVCTLILLNDLCHSSIFLYKFCSQPIWTLHIHVAYLPGILLHKRLLLREKGFFDAILFVLNIEYLIEYWYIPFYDSIFLNLFDLIWKIGLCGQMRELNYVILFFKLNLY